MDSLNFPEKLLFEKVQNGKENGKPISLFPNCKILSVHYSIWLTEYSRDSRNRTNRDNPDFPAIPAHPIGGEGNGKQEKRIKFARVEVKL